MFNKGCRHCCQLPRATLQRSIRVCRTRAHSSRTMLHHHGLKRCGITHDSHGWGMSPPTDLSGGGGNKLPPPKAMLVAEGPPNPDKRPSQADTSWWESLRKNATVLGVLCTLMCGTTWLIVSFVDSKVTISKVEMTTDVKVLETNVDQVKTEMGKITQALEKMDSRMESRLEKMESRMEWRMDKMESQMGKMTQALEKMDSRMESRLDKMESRMESRLDSQMDKVHSEVRTGAVVGTVGGITAAVIIIEIVRRRGA